MVSLKKVIGFSLSAVMLLFLFGCQKQPTIRDVVTYFEEITSETFGLAESKVGYSEKTNTIMVHIIDEGIDDSVVRAQNGDNETVELWRTVGSDLSDLCDFMHQYAVAAGFEDVSVQIFFVHAVTGAAHLEVTNGEITYDILANAQGKWKKAYTFTSGNYVAGVDFGPGTYDIEAISGKGNVYSSDLAINTILSSESGENSFGRYYDSTYTNVYLEEGVTLSADGVKIRITLTT